jgi:hypothetical protein
MMLSRRNLLKGLIAAPLVITTPGLLMPVKAIEPAYGMYVKGVWLDGTPFHIEIEHKYSAADIGGMDWFGMVKRFDSVEYMDVERKQLVATQNNFFGSFGRWDAHAGAALVPYHMREDRPQYSDRIAPYYTLDVLKEKYSR